MKVLHIKYWDGIRDVWKKRPRDVCLSICGADDQKEETVSAYR